MPLRERPAVSRVREGAADKTAVQLVEVQPCQSPMSDMKRRHCLARVTDQVLRGVNGPAARRTRRGRSNPGA